MPLQLPRSAVDCDRTGCRRMSASAFRVRVECYAGYRGEQEPRRFRLGARDIEVRAILDRWLGPEHRYFKVEGDEGATYILRHDTVADCWEITYFCARG